MTALLNGVPLVVMPQALGDPPSVGGERVSGLVRGRQRGGGRGAGSARERIVIVRDGYLRTVQEAQHGEELDEEAFDGVAAVVASALAAVSLAFAGNTSLKLSADKTKLAYNKKTLKAKTGKVTITMLNTSSIFHARHRGQGQGHQEEEGQDRRQERHLEGDVQEPASPACTRSIAPSPATRPRG